VARDVAISFSFTITKTNREVAMTRDNGYVPKPKTDQARQPTAGEMTIIKSEFYRLSSQVSRLWGHRQESMAGSG
jgi:hypothetical protein